MIVKPLDDVIGTADDVDCAVGAAPCLTPSQAHGFVLDEAEVRTLLADQRRQPGAR